MPTTKKDSEKAAPSIFLVTVSDKDGEWKEEWTAYPNATQEGAEGYCRLKIIEYNALEEYRHGKNAVKRQFISVSIVGPYSERKEES